MLFFLTGLCSLWDLSYLTRDWTHTLSSEKMESYALDCQGIPLKVVLYIFKLFWLSLCFQRAYLVAQRLKRLPAIQETRVRSLGREHCLEKEVATHSSILAWRIPWREEPGRLQSMGSQIVVFKSNEWSLRKASLNYFVSETAKIQLVCIISSEYVCFSWLDSICLGQCFL